LTGLLRAEFLKMRKRWMPYVLLLLMLVGAAFLIWAVGYSDRHSDDPVYAASIMRTFVYPYSVPALLDSGQFWGSAIFVAILTTSTLATENNWGTIRPALTGGVSRTGYLMSKLLIVTLVSIVALLIALGFGVVMSLWATSAAGLNAPVPHPGSFTAGDFVLMVLRTAVCIVPYGLLAFALTTLFRSTAVGVAGTMGYMVLEAIIVAVMGTGGDIFQDLRVLFLGHDVSALIAENRFGGLDYESMALRDMGQSRPGVWTATIVIVVESALLLATSLLVFLRRDVTISQNG
jgi:ABC-type transport system involved in multi-copper enzyme maturation permease subunit